MRMTLNEREKHQVYNHYVWLVVTVLDSTSRTFPSSQIIFLESTEQDNLKDIENLSDDINLIYLTLKNTTSKNCRKLFENVCECSLTLYAGPLNKSP